MIKFESINKAVCILIAWLCFFSPLSQNGVVISTKMTILLWGLLLIALALNMYTCGVKNIQLVISGFIIAYLLCATLVIAVGDEFEFSFARLVPVLCANIICIIHYKKISDVKFLIRLFDFIIVTLFFVNILIFVHNAWIIKWISNNYTQYFPNITEYHLSIMKPLGLFGVHNQAAFIYCGLYIISNILYQYTRAIRYPIYMIVLLLLNILLRSTTSLGFAAVMLGIFVYTNRKSKPLMFLSVCIVSVVVLLFLQSKIFGDYLETLSNGVNGFFPRYVEGLNGLYKNNIEIVKQFLLGIGFTIPQNNTIYFADSGYLIFYTMGNIVFAITFYILFLKSLCYEIKSKEYRLFFALYVLLMELGFVSFLALKTICFYWLMYIYIKSFENEQGKIYDRAKKYKFKIN